MTRDLLDEFEENEKRTTILTEEPTKPPRRETTSGWIHAREWNRVVPAARCRECGEITWKLSLSGGPQKLVDSRKHGPVHKEGCSKPPGRLDRRFGHD